MVNIQHYHIAYKNYASHTCYAFQEIQYLSTVPFLHNCVNRSIELHDMTIIF